MGDLRNVYAAFVLIALGGLLFGYIIGITSNVVTEGQIICSQAAINAGKAGTWTSFGYDQCYVIGDWEKGSLASLNIVGATLSSLFCFRFGDVMGRKREVQTGAALYLLGSMVAALAPVKWAIYVGLTVYGLGIGFAMHAAPVYIAEICPADVRGMLVSAKEAVIVLGIFAGYTSGWAFAGIDTQGWRYMIGLAGFIALVLGVGISSVHRSPRWLVLQAVRRGGLLDRYMDEARASLQFYRRGELVEQVEEELQQIRSDAAAFLGESNSQGGFCDVFRFPKPLIIGCGLVFLQQVTGQPSVLYFATNLFKAAGFDSLAPVASVIVGFVKLIATLFTVWRVDQFGRRQLLLWGVAMMTLALVMLSVAFLYQTCEVPGVSLKDCPKDKVSLPQGWAVLTVVALGLYVSGYQVGFGPIAWLMISEVFPLGVRGAALSTAAMVNFSSNVLVSLCQPELMAALSAAGVFGIFLIMSFVSLVFVQCIVPETKGKTLEEIERMMTGSAGGAPRELSKTNERAGLSIA